MNKKITKLNPRKRYLQIALNNTLEEAQKIIAQIPISDRILIEAGTPLIKRYGEEGIKQIKKWYTEHIIGEPLSPLIGESEEKIFSKALKNSIELLANIATKKYSPQRSSKIIPYVVADLKTMDRAETEVEMAARAGADAVIALGHAPIESLNAFIQKCEEFGLDSIIDMMNVEFPLSILRQLKKPPRVVILHRGADEEKFNKEKTVPLHEIRRIKGNYNILLSVAGIDSVREIQMAIFNDANIVVVWKSFLQGTPETTKLIEEFLKKIK
mgnify:CR=1 FL=1